MLHNNLSVLSNGHLAFAGKDTVELAKKYGTPLYVMDYDSVSDSCNRIKNAGKKFFGEKFKLLYASKALSYVDIYRLIKKNDIGIDTVSFGEIYTALKAGFPSSQMYFHGNNKPYSEIKLAIENNVGCFVADNREEIDNIQKASKELGKKQKILLRVSPGIDPHTHKAIVTGSVDSKFGSAIETGQALELIKHILTLSNINFAGIHCHIGSQIFETEPFIDAMKIMLKFVKEIKVTTGAIIREVNLGGGLGIKYDESDPTLDIEAFFSEYSSCYNTLCENLGIDKPLIIMELGRYIVGASGITLYTIGSYKSITNYKNYISIDGGMPDNPRYALYKAKYSVLVANKADKAKEVTATIAGRCCESGDLIQENVEIQSCEQGDILAVLSTGAYNYSMASNYNRLPRPALIAIESGKERVAIRRETPEDLTKNEL